MKRAVLGLILALAAPLPVFAAEPATAASPTAADRQLKVIYDAEWQWRMKEFAQVEDGLRTKDGDHLYGVTPADWERRKAYWSNVIAQIDKIPLKDLSPEERLNAQVLREQLRANVTNIGYRTYEAPLNSDSFFWTEVKPYGSLESAQEYRNYLGRLRDIPRYFGENIANMRSGLKRGYTIPRVVLTGRDDTIVPFIKTAPDNPLFVPFLEMPESIPLAERQALQDEAKRLIDGTAVPAYQQLLSFMRQEYMPGARTSIAASALPDGPAFYKAQIKEYTTLDLTAEEIHQLGLKEVARIDADMQATMKAVGFKGTFPEFLAFLRSDPRFYAKTPAELLGFSSYVAKRMDGKLKDVFGTLPRYRFTIKPVPDAIAPIYTSGRGGLSACLMNTYDLKSRPLYNLTALTLHECAPGHSHQAAVALEAPDRPPFRREAYFSGYGEGWGLYTEWLGSKIGMYETPYDEFGRETFEMWRAARLVIDTGIHSQGWTRQQAIDYLSSHTALAELDIKNEVDRYISWGGQALAYKLGELKIRELRAKAEAELGPKFDQRPFHDTLLAMGSVPLPVMESEMLAWIAAEKSKSAP
jgi:uncharacterized protein (DUF885 family)